MRSAAMTDQIPASALSPANQRVIPFPAAAGTAPSATKVDNDVQTPDGLPDGFFLHDDGIYQLRPSEGEDLIPVRICSPLVVNGMCRNLNGKGWGRVVSVHDPDGGWHETILNARDISKKTTVTLNVLFDNGLELAPVDKAAQTVL